MEQEKTSQPPNGKQHDNSSQNEEQGTEVERLSKCIEPLQEKSRIDNSDFHLIRDRYRMCMDWQLLLDDFISESENIGQKPGYLLYQVISDVTAVLKSRRPGRTIGVELHITDEFRSRIIEILGPSWSE